MMRIQPRASAPARTMGIPFLIGVVGGVLDLGTGLLVLVSARMSAPDDGMGFSWGYAAGILLLVLGGAVLASAIFLFVNRMTTNRRILGFLMLMYSGLMLLVGIGMLGRMFPLMHGSELSGAAMIAVGLAMLYSGVGMGRR